MSKELEALKRIETTFSMNKQGKESVYRDYTNSIYPYYEDFNLVLNALKRLEEQEKVLEIIKENYVDLVILRDVDIVEKYNKYIKLSYCRKELTQEEFELLKRWLENA